MRLAESPSAKKPSPAVLTLALTLSALAPGFLATARAQPAPAAPPASTPSTSTPTATPPAPLAPLTDAQVVGFIAAQKDLAAIGDQEPEESARAKETAILKKYGFPDAAAYGRVFEAVTAVIAGIDEQTGKYVGSDALIRQQIADLKADAKTPAAEKAETIKELEQALASPSAAPPPGDVEIVLRHYKEIEAVLPQDAEDQ